jgi:hypothetical protein
MRATLAFEGSDAGAFAGEFVAMPAGERHGR